MEEIQEALDGHKEELKLMLDTMLGLGMEQMHLHSREAGGGGWYGGGVCNVSGDKWNSAAAGGSGYIGGVLNGNTENGVKNGNGYAKITKVIP